MIEDLISRKPPNRSAPFVYDEELGEMMASKLEGLDKAKLLYRCVAIFGLIFSSTLFICYVALTKGGGVPVVHFQPDPNSKYTRTQIAKQEIVGNNDLVMGELSKFEVNTAATAVKMFNTDIRVEYEWNSKMYNVIVDAKQVVIDNQSNPGAMRYEKIFVQDTMSSTNFEEVYIVCPDLSDKCLVYPASEAKKMGGQGLQAFYKFSDDNVATGIVEQSSNA